MPWVFRYSVVPFAVVLLVVAGQNRVSAAQDCAGDCDGRSQVTAADIVRMSDIAVGNSEVSACVPGDADEDGQITNDDILRAIHNMFAGCAVQPASYDVLAGDLYHVAFPTRDVSLTQAAAILAALQDAGLKSEEELRALLSQLMGDLDVRSARIGKIVIYGARQDADDCDDCLANCKGRCVKSPRGDCFCYEPLPTDPPPVRIAVLLLEQADDEEAALQADRVPCLPALSQGGVDDKFSTANGSELPSPSAGLLSLLQQAPNQPPAGFDGAAKDRVFGHTFTLPQGKCLRAAKVLFRARPLAISPSPSSPNDVVHLGFVNSAGQFVGAHWTAFFGSGNSGLPALLPLSWKPSSYPAPNGASFILDLAALPGGVNLLPDLDTRRELDFYVQDDTSIDYVSLVVRLCDCPTPTPTASRTVTRTSTSTRTRTPSATPSRTATASATLQPTPTVTATATRTPVSTATHTYTATPTVTAPTATATISATPTRTPMCVTPPPNMVAWWPMDETAGATVLKDIVGGNHATPAASPVGAAQAPQPVTGVVGGAIDFQKFGNGLSGARVSAQGSLHAVGSADFTIDAWVKFPPAAANQRHYIVNKFSSPSLLGYGLYVVSPTSAGNEHLEFQWGDGVNTSTVQTASLISTNQFHHVAATFARNVGGNALDIRLYVDGVQDGQQQANPASLGSLTNFVFLEIGDQPALDAPIVLDELEIFDRALAAQEITDIFAAGSAGKCKPPTPTPTPSATATATATLAPTATVTNSPASTPTRTASLTATASATRTPTASSTLTATRTASVTVTPTRTPSPAPTCIPAPASANLVGWWPLDEQAGAVTVVDIGLPPPNNGVPQPAGAIGAPGPFNVAGNLTPPDGALLFPVPTTYVEVAPSPDLNLANSDLTIDAWIKSVEVHPALPNLVDVVEPIVDKLGPGNTGYALYLHIAANCPACPASQTPPPGTMQTVNMYLVFAVGTGSGTITYQSSAIYTGLFGLNPPAVLGQPWPTWQHIAVTVARTAGNAGTFYVNGAAKGTFTPAAGIDSTTSFWIGGTRLYPTPIAIHGEININELEVFNAPLSQPDLQALAGSSTGKCKGTPIATATVTSTRTVTATATRTPTATATATAVSTPTRTATRTGSATPTGTSTASRSATATLTRTPSVTPTVTATCIAPPPDMVAWWTADNTANDLSGNGNHGTLHGSASYTAGMVGAAFSLPTIADYVQVPDSPTLNFTGNFSIDAWINTVNPTFGRATIVDKRTGSNTNPVGYHLFIFNGLLGFQLADGQPSLNQVSPGPLVDDGSWHHVAATINRTSTTGGKLYVDGQLIYTFDPTTRPGSIVNAGTLRLGVRYSGAQTFENFQGAIDEVELFSRELSSQEVHALFESRGSGKCKTPIPTRTTTGTATRTATITSTGTRTASSTTTPRASNTQTSTRTATLTSTVTSTRTITFTVTLTPPSTATRTRTATSTATFTSAGTPTCPGGMCTQTATATRTPTPTTCLAELCASKFLDQDHDGLHDPGEADIAGWFIHVADPSATVIATLLTGVNGCTLVPGMTTYTVSEMLQTGWTQTFPAPPGTHVVFLECGQVVNLEFGNIETQPNTPTRTGTGTVTRTPTKTPSVPPNT